MSEIETELEEQKAKVCGLVKLSFGFVCENRWVISFLLNLFFNITWFTEHTGHRFHSQCCKEDGEEDSRRRLVVPAMEVLPLCDSTHRQDDTASST